MFIKITSIVIYIITVAVLLFLSFKKSVSFWGVGEDTLFFVMMLVVTALIVMLIIAVINLRSIILEWQYAKSIMEERKRMELDNVEDDEL